MPLTSRLRTVSFIRSIALRLLAVSLIAASGCSVGEFIASYFNTYYNAQRLFSEAEEEVWNQPDTRLLGRNLLAQFTIPSGTRTKFLSVIEKTSKLLQYHPESSLVDNALLMIGMSYYYQAEYPKAERKFKELLDGYPSSNLAVEAELMLAYTSYKMNARDAAKKAAREVIERATAEGDDDVISLASAVLAQVERESKNYAEARDLFVRAAELGGPAEHRVGALLSAAEMQAQLGDYAGAEATYRLASERSNTYAGEYRGSIGAVRMRARQGRFEECLQELQELRANSNNREFFGEISLEIANVYRDMNDFPAAVAQYTAVDTLYPRTEVSANSHFQLGLLYETKLFQYDSARAVYTKGKGEFAQASVTPLLTRRAEYMNKYVQYVREIARYDSIRSELSIRRDTLHARQDSVSADSVVSRPQVLPDTARSRAPVPPGVSRDTVDARLALNKNELAGLFYATIGRVDSAKKWYERLVTEHPGSPFVPRALFTLAQIKGQDSSVRSGDVDSLYRRIITRFPDSEFAAESRRILGLAAVPKAGDEAELSYARAEQLSMGGNAGAAADSFKTVATRFPASSVAPRAHYAAGWVYEQVTNQPDSAIAVFERLVSLYPGSQYAVRVQPKLAEVRFMRKAAADAAARDSLAAASKLQSPTSRDSLASDSKALVPAAKDSAAAPPRDVETRPLPPKEKKPVDTPPGPPTGEPDEKRD